MSTTDIPVDNGVNVEALLGVREALADTPDIAQFQWRATTSWVRAPTASPASSRSTASARSSSTGRPSPTTPTTPSSSPPRTTA